ncbi:hypothetical protein NP493_4g14040 [Ridgeia piscesae]|uniref:PiggyBac transposable element-derived protein domain-containing protein n=1 Tax=Ridgeia piscesae TaxID=27915 RepID=A0AAD9ULT3_RIDPI|nr:hypothetical protein NP493_4g14040 [Ridgeia piscesae]
MLQRVFHVGVHDAVPRGHANFDPWNKVPPVLDALNGTFKTHFLPHRCISIDESMVESCGIHPIYAKQVPPQIRHQEV